MINKVTLTSNTSSIKSDNTKNQIKTTVRKDYQKSYMDSFIRNSKETAPILLGLTGLWSLLDYGTGKISMGKAIKNNLAFFFAPVLIVSSSVMAGIENKKTSKSCKA